MPSYQANVAPRKPQAVPRSRRSGSSRMDRCGRDYWTARPRVGCPAREGRPAWPVRFAHPGRSPGTPREPDWPDYQAARSRSGGPSRALRDELSATAALARTNGSPTRSSSTRRRSPSSRFSVARTSMRCEPGTHVGCARRKGNRGDPGQQVQRHRQRSADLWMKRPAQASLSSAKGSWQVRL